MVDYAKFGCSEPGCSMRSDDASKVAEHELTIHETPRRIQDLEVLVDQHRQGLAGVQAQSDLASAGHERRLRDQQGLLQRLQDDLHHSGRRLAQSQSTIVALERSHAETVEQVAQVQDMFPDLLKGDVIQKHLHKIPFRVVFAFPDQTLAVATFAPRPTFDLFQDFRGRIAPQRFVVFCGTAGTGTNTVLLRSTTTSPFTGAPVWTTRATAALAALTRVVVTDFSGWAWNPTTEYLRVECTAIGATAPQDVGAFLDGRVS